MISGHITYQRLILLALLLVIFAGIRTSLVPDDAQGQIACVNAFNFTQTDPIVLGLKVNSEKRVEVTSTDRIEHKVKVELSDLGLRDPDGKSVPTPQIVKVEPPSASLKGSLQFSISVSSVPTLKPGVYIGNLVVFEDAKELRICPSRKQVQLVVPDFLPLVDKASIHAYRLFPLPFNSLWFCLDCVLPLKNAVDPKATMLHQETPLGGVQNEQGETATVFWDSQKPISSESVPQLPLSVKDLKYAGKYDGQLKFDPASDKAPNVNLTVDASDIPLWPILVIGLSIWLALLVQRYLNVTRAIWQLDAKEAALGVAFKQSQQQFDAGARGTPYAAYTIANDFDLKRQGLRQKIADLQRTSTVALDTTSQPYQSILNDFKLFQEAITAWSTFAQELSTLQTALEQHPDFGPPPPGTSNKTPVLLDTFAKTLIGKQLKLDEFVRTRNAVLQDTTSAQLWFALKNRIEKAKALLASLKQTEPTMSQDQRDKLKAAGASLFIADANLWDADSIDTLSGIAAPGGNLDSGEQSSRALAVDLALSAPVENTPTMNALMGSTQSLVSKAMTMEAASVGPADDAKREEFYAGAIRKWDRSLTGLAFIVAVLTGLNSFYLGRPFGTIKDYVGIVVWAVGTKVTVDIVSAALGSLFNGSKVGSFPKSA